MDKNTVSELKKILTDRGIPCNGKLRAELVTLAQKAVKLYREREGCDHELSERKRRCVVVEDGTVDLNGKTVQWTSDLKELPSITCGDVFAYLTVECGWSSQRLKQHKSDDGYRMFVDKHIEMVEVGRIVDTNDFLYVRGKVKPEQRHTAERYVTWLLCCSTGEVKSAGCGCIAADAGSCKHVAALLFAVENFSSRHVDRGTAVGTDQQCKWNQPRRESMPVRIAELDYRHNKDKPRKQACTSFKPVSTVDNAAILKIREKIVASCTTSGHNAIVLTSVLPPPPKNTPPSIPELCARFHSSDEESIVAFISQATSDEHLDYFRSLSQDDEEWLDARKGRITASIAADVRSLRDTSEGKTVIQRVMGTAPRIQTKAMAYGHAHESVARQLYTSEMDKHHKDFECKTTGLHLLPEAPFLGASPDGISSCACHAKRVVEIKCTLKHKNLSVAEIPEIDPSYHLESCNGEVRLKETSSWYFQAQQQMGVLAFDKCDFVIYTRKGINVIDIPFNRALWESLKDKATHVFCKRIAPLLVK